MADQEQYNQGHGDDLSEFERDLVSVKPQPGRLSRGRLMFLAGQASVRPEKGRATRRKRWYWPASTAVMTVVSAALVLIVVYRPVIVHTAQPHVVREVVYVDRATQPPAPAAQSPEPPQSDWTPRLAAETAERVSGDYLDIRHRVLALGVDALPPLSLEGNLPSTSREMLEDMLPDSSYRRPRQPDERGRFNWKSIFHSGELL